MQSVVHASIGQWFDLLINIGGKSPRTFERQSAYSLETLIYGTETREKISKTISQSRKYVGRNCRQQKHFQMHHRIQCSDRCLDSYLAL